jgi:hypothetical protein
MFFLDVLRTYNSKDEDFNSKSSVLQIKKGRILLRPFFIFSRNSNQRRLLNHILRAFFSIKSVVFVYSTLPIGNNGILVNPVELK